jgi:hypothetical protein
MPSMRSAKIDAKDKLARISVGLMRLLSSAVEVEGMEVRNEGSRKVRQALKPVIVSG